MLIKYLFNVHSRFFKIYSRFIQDFFKIYSRFIQDLFKIYSMFIQDLFKIYSMFIQDFFQDLFNVVGSIDRESSQQLPMWFSEYFFAPELAA